MPELAWQKSSFSTGDSGECVELATVAPGHIHLRESDRPTEITSTTPTALAALLNAIKNERIAG